MPFTPLHMGPGAVFKAALRGRFSLLVFGWSQILIDLQPLVVILTDRGELHGISHTFPGATVIALAAALSGKYLGEWGLRLLREPQFLPIGWPAAYAGAFIGTWSHVLIDSIMHADVTPLWPLTQASPLHGIVGIDTLQVLCLALGAAGGGAWWALERRSRNRSASGA